MQATNWTLERKTTGVALRVILGIALLVLVMGFWAYLWVPGPEF